MHCNASRTQVFTWWMRIWQRLLPQLASLSRPLTVTWTGLKTSRASNPRPEALVLHPPLAKIERQEWYPLLAFGYAFSSSRGISFVVEATGSLEGGGTAGTGAEPPSSGPAPEARCRMAAASRKSYPRLACAASVDRRLVCRSSTGRALPPSLRAKQRLATGASRR